MHNSYSGTFRSDPQLLVRDTVSAWGIFLSTSTRSHIFGPPVKYLGSFAEQILHCHNVRRLVRCTQGCTCPLVRLDAYKSSIHGYVSPLCDLRLSGQVIYRGNNYIEVVLTMEKCNMDLDARYALRIPMQWWRRSTFLRTILDGLPRCVHLALTKCARFASTL
ncbi:hypothetical protein H4582DRAFT_1970555 [Lactarius indigo]|nr:hypothetical protein H4582DRAFT_1970555 [Lactarius indigo]